MSEHTGSGSTPASELSRAGIPRPTVASDPPSEGTSLRPPVVERVVRPQDAEGARGRRAERLIALFFVVSALGTAGFIAAYVMIIPKSTKSAGTSNFWLGITMGIAMAGLAVGIIAWVRWIMPAHETVQDRHELASDEGDLEAAAQIVMTGIEETGLPRRSLIKRSLGLAAGVLALPPLVLLRDLGPLPRNSFAVTPWKAGNLMYDAETGKPVKFGDLEVGAFTTVLPAPADQLSEADLSKSSVVIIRLRPGTNHPFPGREGWAYQDHVAYSKICTHVGCPITLYEKQVQQLLCPCHQSTFDVPKACNVIFGPAARRLPQLPITVDADGQFKTTSGFHEPVGPSYWERG